jgi:uncharacterized protein (TIGR02453 family)
MMNSEGEFNGFPKAGLRFLADLRANNNRDWFQANKHIFEEQLVPASQAFVESLGPRLKTLSSGFSYDSRKDGRGSIMRIYRDIRFSKDKTPYYTYMRFRFWEGMNKKESPGIFVWLDDKEAGIHVGMHSFPKEFLTAYRNAVLDGKLGPQLVDVLETLKSLGNLEFSEPHYKRVPRGFDPDHPRAELLRHNTLYASSPKINKSTLLKPDLVDLCLEHVERLIPLHRWLLNVQKMTS